MKFLPFEEYRISRADLDVYLAAVTRDDFENFVNSNLGRGLLGWIANTVQGRRELNDECDAATHEVNKGVIGFGLEFFELQFGTGKEDEHKETNDAR